MSETIRVLLDTDGLSDQVDEIRRDLTNLVEDDLNPLAASLQSTFRELSEAIVSDLEEAASQGRLSVRTMVDDVLNDLAKLAADQFIRRPLENLFSGGISPTGTPIVRGNAQIVRSGAQTAGALGRLLSQAGRNG